MVSLPLPMEHHQGSMELPNLVSNMEDTVAHHNNKVDMALDIRLKEDTVNHKVNMGSPRLSRDQVGMGNPHLHHRVDMVVLPPQVA